MTVQKGTEIPVTTNRGIRVYYEIVGSGPPLVLVHGFTQTNGQWRRYEGLVETLAADYRLILIDAHGHGKSD